MSPLLTPKQFDQRTLDECPRFAGDEQIRAEIQRMIDTTPTELPPLPKPAPGPVSVEAWIDQGIEGMVRMATDEAKRLNVARRLF